MTTTAPDKVGGSHSAAVTVAVTVTVCLVAVGLTVFITACLWVYFRRRQIRKTELLKKRYTQLLL